MYFLKGFSGETLPLVDFNIDTLKDDLDLKKYVTLSEEYDFEIQNKLPTRVTPTSKSCIGHMITQNVVCTKTLTTTISDRFTVLLHFTGRYFILVSSVLYFFTTFLDIQLLREDLKACHFFGKCSDINKPPPVPVKFVYFHLSSKKRCLRKTINAGQRT